MNTSLLAVGYSLVLAIPSLAASSLLFITQDFSGPSGFMVIKGPSGK